MMNKQYDWFATRIFQPEMSLDELFDQGITPENTGFKTREDYKNIASVREQFRTADGGFDEDAFNQAYSASREMYNLYVNREYSKKLLEEYAYDPYEWYAPATEEIIDVSASNAITQNGMFYSTNIAGIGDETESPYSVREIAQKQLVHDENGNQLDWTPEDKGGLLKGLFRDPLVLATYDEDTPEYDESGNLVTVHRRGEYKLNEWGAPYYEMLGDRDAYGKEMLHYTDTFTKEGTVLNKFDFYDSDGKHKSVFGTVMKTAAQIVPMFLHPAVGYTWGALNAAKGIGQSMAALGKGIDAIITGSDDNEFGRQLTKMENWLARFDNSKSDYGQEHMWASAETYGDLIGSTTKQLFEQRLVANIPKQLKFLGTDIQRSKMGQNMAIAYMAATSAKESYQAGIEAGLGDRQAGLLLLANTAAMWKLMDSDYGRSTLFKGSWFDDDITKKTARETADFMIKSTDAGATMEEINEKMAKYGSTRLVKLAGSKVDDAAAGVGKAANKAQQEVAKKGAQEAAEQGTKAAVKQGGEAVLEQGAKAGTELKEKTILETSKDFLTRAYKKSVDSLKNKLEAFKGVEPEEYLAAMLREGVEEVAEEAISDVTKATTLALEALGVKMNDTGKKLDYGFSGKDIFDRYLLSFVGGAVGGGIFRGYSAYEEFRDNNWERKMPDYQKDLIFLIAEGRGDEIVQEYQRLYDKGLLGSKELKSSFKMADDENVDVVGSGELSQADANLKILVGNVRYIEQVINDEGLFEAIRQSKEANIVAARSIVWNERNDHLTEKQKRGAFLMSNLVGAHQLMTHSFIKLAEEFVDARIWYDALTKDLRNKDNLTEEERVALENITKQYTARVKKLREERDKILSGEYNGDYVSSILLETEGVLPKLLRVGKLDKDAWAMSMYGRLYSGLDPFYQKQVDKDMELYSNESANYYGRNFAATHDGTKRIFLTLQRLLRPEFEQQNEALKDKRINEFHTDNYFGEEFFQSIVKYQEDLKKLKAFQIKRDSLMQGNQTAETQKQLQKIEEEIVKLETKLARYTQQYNEFRYIDGDASNGDNSVNLTPTNMLLQRFKDKDENFTKLITTYDLIIRGEDINEETVNLLEQILSIYTEIKNDGGLVQDFGELKMAEQALIKFIDKWEQGKFIYDNEVTAALSEVNPKLLENTLLSRTSSAKRELFQQKMHELKNALNKGDYVAASKAYDVMSTLVLETIRAVRDPKFWFEEVEDSEGTIIHTGFMLNGEDVGFDHNFAIRYFEKAFYFPALRAGDEVLQNPFDVFFKIAKIIPTLNQSPFTQLLRTFKTKVDGDASAVDYLEEFFSKYRTTNNWTDFFIANSLDQDALKDLMTIIDLMELMLTMDSKTIEAMNAFYKDGEKLVVFDPISRRNLLRDLDAVKSKIFVVYQNGKFNTRNRHSEIEKDYKKRIVNEVQNLLKFWGDIEDERKNKEFDILEIWETTIAESELKDSLLLKNIFEKIDPNTLAEKQYAVVYNIINRFKRNVFNAWSAFKRDKGPKEIAEAFIKLFEGHPLYKDILLNRLQNPYDITSNTATTPMETFKYLLAMVSVDGFTLDLAYKQALESFRPSESGVNPIPNDEQELSTKFVAAYLSNPEFWAEVQSVLQSKMQEYSFELDGDKEHAHNVSEIKILNNTIIIPGACGVGKTTMVGAVLEQLWGAGQKAILTAPKSKTTEKLSEAFRGSVYTVVGQSEDGKEIDSKEALFKFLFGEEATHKFDIKVGAICTIDKSKYPFLKVSEEKLKELRKYKLIIIDEIGQYNEIELQLLDEIAREAGIHIIGLGDHCQMGDIVTDGEQTYNSNYQDVVVWKAPYLVRSMRNSSIAKGANNARLGRNIYAIESFYYKTEDEVIRAINEGDVWGTNIETHLKYSVLLESGFCGDRITTDRTEFDEIVEHLLMTRQDGDTISIVIDDASKKDIWIQKIKKLNIENWEEIFLIKDITKNEINGYETSYTIVDVNWSTRLANSKTAWKEFYTISQRSHLGTLFLDETDSLKKIHIYSELDPDGHRIWNNDPAFVKQWFESRMSLFAEGSGVLFMNPESAFPVNYSTADEEERRRIEVPPTLEEISEEVSEEVSEESKNVEEQKKELEKEQIENEINDIKLAIEAIIAQLYIGGFRIEDDIVTSDNLNNLDSMTIEQCNEFLALINQLLTEIDHINDVVRDSKNEVKNAVESKINSLNKFKSFLNDATVTVNDNISQITTSISLNDTKVELQRMLTDIKEKKEKLNESDITQYQNQLDALINSYDVVISFVNKLTKDKIDLLAAEGFEITILTDARDQIVNKLNELKRKINEEIANFNLNFPTTLDVDEIESYGVYKDLSKEEKDKTIAEIQKVIQNYEDAIAQIDNYENSEFISDLIKNRKIEWESRVLELKSLIENLRTIEPVSPKTVNWKELNKISKEASDAWGNVDFANVGIDVLRNALAASQYVIQFANDILMDDSLTEKERESVQKLIEYHEELIENNEPLLNRISEEFQYDDEVYVTRGFEVNQQFAEGVDLDIQEIGRILQEHDATIDAEEVVRRKFSKLGAKQYMELREKTKDGLKVTVWGLDLETTGKHPRTAEIAQIGLVKYEISRVGENWKIRVVKGSEIDKFVQPSTIGLTPPAKFDDGTENPIYEEWSRTSERDKYTEAKALETIFGAIEANDYVITYNGRSYDFEVIRARAKALGVTGSLNDDHHIDVYADFVGMLTSNVGGTDLLWQKITVENSDGTVTTVREPIGHFSDHKLSTVAACIEKTLPTSNLSAHNAIADVHMTLDVLMNMFNGIPTFIGRQSLISGQYDEKGVGNDFYIGKVLIPYVKDVKTKGLYPDVTESELLSAFIKIRHRILSGDSEIVHGKKIWIYDLKSDTSTLIYEDLISKYNGLPLLVVKGKRTGEYKGTFEYQQAKFATDATEDVDLLELRRRDPTLRFSRPFVLTGLGQDQIMALEKLSGKARSFYDPENKTRNLGKTFVLVTSDPTFEDNWDPSEALTPRVVDGELHWRNADFKMLTVSREAKLQEMIDFAIASCCLASGIVYGSHYMEDFFKSWKASVNAAKDKVERATTASEKIAAERELDNVLMIAGITLSRTQYEKILKDASYEDKAKVFYSDVFAVMNGRKVGDFMAAFINACILHQDEVTNVLSARTGYNLPSNKVVHQWIFDNLLESVRKKSYRKNWVSEKTFSDYYTLDLTVGTDSSKVDFKIVCEDGKIYVFQDTGDIDISEKIEQIKTGTKGLDKDGVVFSGNNTSIDIFSALETYFNGKFGSTVKFSKIALMQVASPKNSVEIRQAYPVSANEVFTRAFTTWTNNGAGTDVPAGLRGWNDIYEIIKRDMEGYTHDIYGHEIIDKTSDSTMRKTIFAPSICNNSLNGEYRARTAKLIQYGKWSVKDDVDEVDAFKTTIQTFVSEIGQLGGYEFKTQFESQLDVLAQNASNRGLDEAVIKNYLVSEANRLYRELNKDSLKEKVFFVNSVGEFEVSETFKDDPEFLTAKGYNMDYCMFTGDRKTKMFIKFDNGEATSFVIENVNETLITIDLTQTSPDYLLFKKILLTLWNKDIPVTKDQIGNFVKYYLQKALHESGELSDVIVSGVRNYIALLEQQNIDIFTDELKESLKNNFDVFKVIVSDDIDLFESFKFLIESGSDFHEALDLIGFDPFSVIKRVC